MADIRFTAKQYIDAGWSVVPLVKGEKRASSSWQNKTYTVNDFKDGDGIAGKCGEPSGWRVDVDLDCPEAIDCAPAILMTTGLVHGRPSKPSSHWWYHCEDIRTYQFTDIKSASGAKEMLVEIRSTGGYTALPPSIHPSGEELVWDIDRNAADIDKDRLYASVRDVALCSLLARYWPGTGARHAFAGHLAGFLLQAKVSPAEVLCIIQEACRIAKDKDVHDRVSFAQGTIAKHKNGEKVTGGPKLVEALSESIVARMRGWLKLKDTDALEEMNQRHFFVRMGKDAVIGREDDPAGVIFQPTKALYTEYANKKIVVGEDKDGKPAFKPLFQEWLESESRRSYRRVVFAPPPLVADTTDFNLWQGYAVEPQAGDTSLYMRHLHEVICSGNDEHANFLLHLLALTIQEPGSPSGIATVLRGEPGTGKGIFVRAIGDIFGRRHYTQLDKVDQLAGHFNSALSGKIIVFADEAFWAGDKREVGALKRLITEPTLHIVRKGIDGIDEDNHIHLFMATNEDWSWPAMMKERRGFLLKVSSDKMQDPSYFTPLAKEIKNGGLSALLHYFLNFKVDRALLKKVPYTKELRQQQTKSLGPLEEWWYECLYEARIGQLGWQDSTWIPANSVYKAYEEWTGRHKGRLLPTMEFGRKMTEMISGEKSKAKRVNGEVTRCLCLRTLQEARNYFDKQMGSQGEWPSIQEDDPQAIPF